jgi:hypothetical protein
MSSKFYSFISTFENTLRTHLKNGEIKEFSEKLSKLYPSSIKFFTNDTENLLTKLKAVKFINQFRKISTQLISQYHSYEVQADKVVLTRKDLTKEEYPLINVTDLINRVLELQSDELGTLLVTSYMIQPLNFDFVQLFGIYLSKL